MALVVVIRIIISSKHLSSFSACRVRFTGMKLCHPNNNRTRWLLLRVVSEGETKEWEVEPVSAGYV